MITFSKDSKRLHRRINVINMERIGIGPTFLMSRSIVCEVCDVATREQGDNDRKLTLKPYKMPVVS